jgi:hypothetical protein
MSLKIRFRFDGKCLRHPRYNPLRDGRPRDGNCEGCESLYVIHLYTKVARNKAHNSTGILGQVSTGREKLGATEDLPTRGRGRKRLIRRFSFISEFPSTKPTS